MYLDYEEENGSEENKAKIIITLKEKIIEKINNEDNFEKITKINDLLMKL